MIRYLKVRPRLLTATTFGIALWFFLPGYLRPATHFLVAWDTAIILYICAVGAMMMRANHSEIRSRAAAQDEGRVVILTLTTLTALASLAAIVAELSTAKEYSGYVKGFHIGLAGLTVFLSWTFM